MSAVPSPDRCLRVGPNGCVQTTHLDHGFCVWFLSVVHHCPLGIDFTSQALRYTYNGQHGVSVQRIPDTRIDPQDGSYVYETRGLASLFLVANLVPSSKARSPVRSIRSLLVAMPGAPFVANLVPGAASDSQNMCCLFPKTLPQHCISPLLLGSVCVVQVFREGY